MPVLPTTFSPATVSRVALINAIANGVIVVTGGAVRLTGSGLGCPTWPRCTGSSIVPTPELAGHGVIEFGNRLLTFVLTAAAIATVVVVFRSVRRDLRRLAVISFLGIPAQALLGGVTVLTGLNPWTVAAHFLLSMVLVAVATTLWLRSREPGVGNRCSAAVRPARRRHRGGDRGRPGHRHRGHRQRPAQRRPRGGAHRLRPRAGQPAARRRRLPADRAHRRAAGGAHAIDSPDRVRRAARDLLIVQLAQGVIGYVQYFTDLPIVLVLVHMLGAVLITAFTARLIWSVRGPASELPLDAPAKAAVPN